MLFVVKTACCEWGQVYLVEERGVSSSTSSSYFTALEVGGIFGTILLGAGTDFMIRRNYYFRSGKSPRMIVVQLCVAGSFLFLNGFLFGANSETTKVGGSLQDIIIYLSSKFFYLLRYIAISNNLVKGGNKHSLCHKKC